MAIYGVSTPLGSWTPQYNAGLNAKYVLDVRSVSSAVLTVRWAVHEHGSWLIAWIGTGRLSESGRVLGAWLYDRSHDISGLRSIEQEITIPLASSSVSFTIAQGDSRDDDTPNITRSFTINVSGQVSPPPAPEPEDPEDSGTGIPDTIPGGIQDNPVTAIPESAFRKRPWTVVELDQDWCSLTYGNAPCTAVLAAGGEKCWNTFATCQDKPNYARSTKTLRFGMADSEAPRYWPALLPSLVSASLSPTILNIAALDRNMRPLGKRAAATIRMMDFAYGDQEVDKYVSERSWDPAERGTFWGKWRARNQHWKGRAIRVLEGDLDKEPGDAVQRHYIIDSIEGPNADGSVLIKAKDILSLASESHGKVPAPTKSVTTADFPDPDNPTSTFLPVSDFTDISGSFPCWVRIGDEIIWSQNGVADAGKASGRINLSRRGQFGSEVQDSIKAGARVQLCAVWQNKRIDAVVRDLLVDWAGIPESYIPTAEWNQEAGTWLLAHIVSACISKPTSIEDLLGELCRTGIYIWWDERVRRIRLRAVRPATGGPAIPEWTDERDLLDQTSIRERDDERITQLYLYYDQADAAGSLEDPANYKRLQAHVDLSAEGASEYGDKSVVQLFSRWLGAEDSGIALSASNRMFSRYRNTPRQMTVLVSEGAPLAWTGDVVYVESRQDQGFDGSPARRAWQVISAKPENGAMRCVLQASDYSDIGSISTPGTPGGGGGSPGTPGGGLLISSRFAYVQADNAPDYSSASASQREPAGGWICANNGLIGTDSGYLII